MSGPELDEEAYRAGPKLDEVEPIKFRFDEERFWVELNDGRVLGAPLDWFPRLLRATAEQREAVWFSPSGLHWDEIDEDISVAGLLAGRWDNTKLGRQHRAAHSAGRAAQVGPQAPLAVAE
jgi:hypothetical protein